MKAVRAGAQGPDAGVAIGRPPDAAGIAGQQVEAVVAVRRVGDARERRVGRIGTSVRHRSVCAATPARAARAARARVADRQAHPRQVVAASEEGSSAQEGRDES